MSPICLMETEHSPAPQSSATTPINKRERRSKAGRGSTGWPGPSQGPVKLAENTLLQGWYFQHCPAVSSVFALSRPIRGAASEITTMWVNPGYRAEAGPATGGPSSSVFPLGFSNLPSLSPWAPHPAGTGWAHRQDTQPLTATCLQCETRADSLLPGVPSP